MRKASSHKYSGSIGFWESQHSSVGLPTYVAYDVQERPFLRLSPTHDDRTYTIEENVSSSILAEGASWKMLPEDLFVTAKLIPGHKGTPGSENCAS